MNDLLVIVPSRGRPQNLIELVRAWMETEATAHLLFGLDDDDSTTGDVQAGPIWSVRGPRLGMGGTLNALAVAYAPDYRYVGFMGDDHRPRTPGWDRTIVRGLDDRADGIGYGDDLVHGEALPTAAVVSSSIVRRLGYIAPPRLKHLYLDNFWLTLGTALGSLRYFPDVVIEHVHPIAGKAEWDEGYRRVNAGDIAEHDRAEFKRWKAEDLTRDVEKIRGSAAVH